MENERIETSTIVKRLEDCKVLTKDGNVVNLIGPIDDYRTVANGFSLQTVHLFLSGFPHIWNLVVGMGLPAKAIAPSNTSHSCDFYCGEVTSQVSLQKDIQVHGKCMHQSSAPEGKVNEMSSCLDVERPHGSNFFTEKGSLDVEAVTKVPESLVMQELQEQANNLLNVKPQVSEDLLPSIVQLHEEELERIDLVGAEADKETDLLRECKSDTETRSPRDSNTDHEAFHGQLECIAKQLMDSMTPTCEIENGPIENVETAMTESRSEDKESNYAPKVSTIYGNTLEENQGKKAFVEARANAKKPLDLINNSETVALSDKKLDLSPIQSRKEIDCGKESRTAKATKQSHSGLLRKRKVNFNIQDNVENKAQSCTSIDPETPPKILGKYCCLNSNQADHIPSSKNMDGEKGTVTKTVVAKKGKRRKKARFLLPKYKRSTKLMISVNTHEDTKDGKGARNVCNDKVLEPGCNTFGNKNQTDGQDGAILSQSSSPNQTAEGKAGITALILEPSIKRTVETRQGNKEKFYIKKAAQKKIIAKRKRRCLANVQQTLNETRVHNDFWKTEKNYQVSSMIHSQKVEAKVTDNSSVGRKTRKSGEEDSNLYSSKLKRDKLLKKIERGDLEDSTCGKETLEGFCKQEAHAECDNGLSSVASPRKRLKQILPPPLPLPLVSVSKQLVSKAFGLKTSRSGRLLVPPLAHWRGQSLVRDMDGGIIAIEDGSTDAPRVDTGCFTFKPPTEARAKKLQKWLCETATECLTKKQRARKSATNHKLRCVSS